LGKVYIRFIYGHWCPVYVVLEIGPECHEKCQLPEIVVHPMVSLFSRHIGLQNYFFRQNSLYPQNLFTSCERGPKGPLDIQVQPSQFVLYCIIIVNI